ncbi:hypothetical protein MPSI1_000835 [Malassezia psittaci]|uniref:Uncharacterized protein n=1 Tax=Malassezia psittaci TaxID=1821823 RepID=A0AAF0JDA2_9BASI|nr:hypothetical protein MPSI1_000835 [Malassezia psittaci]
MREHGALLKLLALLCIVVAVRSVSLDRSSFEFQRRRHTLERRDLPSYYTKDIGIYPGGNTNGYIKGWTELPAMDGAKVDNDTFTVGTQGATITTYINENYDASKIKRVVIQVHGEYRDAWNQWMYANMSATNASKISDFSIDEVLVVAPMFFSLNDYQAYPHDANNVSTTKILVWDQNGWGDTEDALWPSFNSNGQLDNPAYNFTTATSSKSKSTSKSKSKSKSTSKSKKSSSSEADNTATDSSDESSSDTTSSLAKRRLIDVSSEEAASNGPGLSVLDVFDAYVNYFSNKAIFPNMQTIVVAGFSMGGQAVNRYVTFRPDTSKESMINYWISSPASFLYLNDSRPVPSSSCKDYDDYKYGLNGTLPGYVNRTAAENTPEIIQNRYLSRKVSYFVGLQDSNDGDNSCAANTQGKGHVDRMDNWVQKVLPYLPNNTRSEEIPTTVSYARIESVPHLANGVILSSAGMQTLFTDDFNGRNNNAKGPQPVKYGAQTNLTPDADLPSSAKSGSQSRRNTPGVTFIATLAALLAYLNYS